MDKIAMVAEYECGHVEYHSDTWVIRGISYEGKRPNKIYLDLNNTGVHDYNSALAAVDPRNGRVLNMYNGIDKYYEVDSAIYSVSASVIDDGVYVLQHEQYVRLPDDANLLSYDEAKDKYPEEFI